MKPVLYLLAGPNGAGKSALYRSAKVSMENPRRLGDGWWSKRPKLNAQ